MTNLKTRLLEEFESLGFGNQAVIVGAKRVELKDWLSQALSSLTDPEELVREIDHLFKDHYWDSLQPDRKLLLKHWKFILTLLKSKKI